MPEGPTTEGSIVAYLRLDDSDFMEKLDQAEARAKELGRTDPNIRVTADTADAAAKLEALKAIEDRVGGGVGTGSGAAGSADAVAAAQSRLAAAEAKSAAATEALNVAEDRATAARQRFNIATMRELELDDKKRVSDSQAAAATLATFNARVAASNASAKAAVAQQKVVETAHAEALAEIEVAAAQEKATRATLEGTAANNEQAASADKAAKANHGNASYMGMIVGAVAALIPLAAPLAGFALGGAGALTEMGIAGVLALKGIGAEMAADTDLGGQYQDGLAAVQNDLHQLEATAAAGVITPFNKALDYLQPQMPRINQDMGAMASWAGQIAGTSLQGIVGGFETMEPLLVSGENLLQGWASNMALFGRSPEFREFVQYAVAELPQVNGLLINLGGTVVHLVEAFTPIGNVVIPVLSAVTFGLNAIPTPVLSGLAVGATAVGVSFLAWNYAIEPLLTKMGVLGGESATVAGAQTAVAASATAAAAAEDGAAAATTAWGAAIDFATGPVGIIIGLGAALVSMLMASANGADTAAKASQDYATALQADNGAMADNVKAAAVKALHDDGAIQAAHQLGISTKLLMDATLGNSSAQGELSSKIAKVESSLGTAGGATGAMTDKQNQQAGALVTLKSAYNSQSDSLKSSVATYKALQDAMGQTGATSQALAQDQNMLDDASKGADSATQGYIDALQTYAKSAGTAADQGAFLGQTLVAMQGDWLSYDSSLANASFANYTLTQTFQDQGKEVAQGVKYIRDTEKAAIDLNTGMIDVSKSGAPALLQQLTAMQSAAQKAAAATYQHEEATKGAGQAAADAATIFKGDTYDALVKDADQLGLTADQAKKLADRYFGLPSDVITQLQTQGQATVVQTLDGIGQQLAEISGHPWTSTLDANGVPLSHEAYLAQLRLDQIKQIDPTTIAADAKQANMTVDQFKQHLVDLPDKTVTVTADTAAAEAAIARLQANSQVVANQYAAGNVYTTGKADGGVLYRADGGPAYLAAGGMPDWSPRGTDTVPIMASPGEFLVKEKSASYDPQFLKAYNADPARALAAKQGHGGGGTSVSLEGATIVLDVGGEKVTGVIRRQVVRAMGDFAQQISGGATV